MARPKADLPEPQAIRALLDGEGRLAVRVTPGAREESLAISAGKLAAKVRAEPTDGAANEAVLAAVARVLGVPRSQVELLRGATSREKLLLIRR